MVRIPWSIFLTDKSQQNNFLYICLAWLEDQRKLCDFLFVLFLLCFHDALHQIAIKYSKPLYLLPYCILHISDLFDHLVIWGQQWKYTSVLFLISEVNNFEAEVFQGILLVAGFSNVTVMILKFSSFKAPRAVRSSVRLKSCTFSYLFRPWIPASARKLAFFFLKFFSPCIVMLFHIMLLGS